MILAEDTIVIFSFDVYSDIMVKINNRSFSEDMMSILYSAYALVYLTRQLQGPLIEIQAPDMTGNAFPAPDDGMTAMTDAGMTAMADAGRPRFRPAKRRPRQTVRRKNSRMGRTATPYSFILPATTSSPHGNRIS